MVFQFCQKCSAVKKDIHLRHLLSHAILHPQYTLELTKSKKKKYLQKVANKRNTTKM